MIATILIGLIGGGMVGGLVGLVGRVITSAGAGPAVPGVASAVLSVPQTKIIQAADQVIKSGATSSSCWHWIELIFKRAGLYQGSFGDWFAYIWKGGQYDKSNPQKFLTVAQLDILKPGDWLYIHNANQYDRNGNHSVLFMSWIDRQRGLARVAFTRFAGKAGEIGTRDLIAQPVAYIMRSRSV